MERQSATDCACCRLDCCCGPETCHFCCKGCPPIFESLSTRVTFTFIFLLGLILGCLWQQKMFLNAYKLLDIDSNRTACVFDSFHWTCWFDDGYMNVYRSCLAFAAFFFLLWLISIWISNSDQCRAWIHNGFWLPKIILLVVLYFSAFIIPNTAISRHVIMIIGLCGAVLFLLIQMFLLIDFAHSWNARWLARAHDEDICWNKCWLVAINAIAAIFFFATCTAFAFTFFYYTGVSSFPALLFTEICLKQKVIVGVNCFICIILGILSYSVAMRELNPNTSPLQASIITMYVAYLTWSGLTNLPKESHLLESMTKTNLTAQCYPPELLSSQESEIITSTDNEDLWFGDSLYGYLIVFFLMAVVVYQSIRVSTQSKQLGLLTTKYKRPTRPSQSPSSPDIELPTEVTTPSPNEPNCCSRRPSKFGQIVMHNEAHHVVYSYAFFHFTYCLALLYTMAQLTNWYQPMHGIHHLQQSTATFWIKLGSAWLCIVLYLITIFSPRLFNCFAGKDFSYIPYTLERKKRHCRQVARIAKEEGWSEKEVYRSVLSDQFSLSPDMERSKNEKINYRQKKLVLPKLYSQTRMQTNSSPNLEENRQKDYPLSPLISTPRILSPSIDDDREPSFASSQPESLLLIERVTASNSSINS